ncbi:MAG: phage tail tube protein [Eudoraea sp.]|nr:phage tail tube protein [Eudoraea sp.]
MAVKDGSDIWVQTAGTLVNGMTEKSLDLSANEIDVTTQDSDEWQEFISGFKSGVLTFSCKDDESDANAYDELFTAFDSGAAVAFAYGDGIKTAGNRVMSGSAIITSLTHNGPMDAATTFSVTLRVTGEVTSATSTTTVA